MKLALLAVMSVSLLGCGGKPATPTPPTGPAPGACPSVTISCQMGGGMCIEGGDDFSAAAGDCDGAGASRAPCTRDGTIGTCTAYEKLVPKQQGCATMVAYPGGAVASTDELRGLCDRFGGTFTAP